MPKQNNGKLHVYIGTYTRGRSEGIYLYYMDKSTGALEFASVAGGIENPAFLAIHPEQRYQERLTQINPKRLWKRTCEKCNRDIQSSYSPERLERICCEQCYLSEVY